MPASIYKQYSSIAILLSSSKKLGQNKELSD